jgi:hypothetical protein
MEAAKNIDEVFVKNILSDFETDLGNLRKHLDNNFIAYKWLYGQSQFESAVKFIFPKKKYNWMDDEVAYIVGKINTDSSSGFERALFSNKLLIELIGKTQLKMQAELKWISLLCSCLISYYYPTSNYLNRVKEKSVDAHKKIALAIMAIKDIESFPSYFNNYPVVTPGLINELDELASSLDPIKLDDCLIFKRADVNFKEKLFVINIFNKTVELGVGGNKSKVYNSIYCILSMEGFVNSMVFETIERICSNKSEKINYITDYSKNSETSLYSLIQDYRCLVTQNLRIRMQKDLLEHFIELKKAKKKRV